MKHKRSLLRVWLFASFAVLTIGIGASQTWGEGLLPPRALAQKPWIFFDLGDTIVSAPTDPNSHDIVRLSWVRFAGDDGKIRDARSYLSGLKAKGYGIGLIANIPEKWGDPELKMAKAWVAETDPAKREALARALTKTKVQSIGDYFEGHGPGDSPTQKRRWSDPRYRCMDWSIFPEGAILVPFVDENRKPDRGPFTSEEQLFLFQSALRLASKAGRSALYLGENPFEIDAAARAGLATKRLVYVSGVETQTRGFLPSEAEIDRLTRPVGR